MSRSDQYIGLNDYAKAWIEAHQGDAFSKSIFLCHGLCDEIHGTEYHLIPPGGPNKDMIAVETVQQIPWSSGPMIFTYLKVFLVKESGERVEWGDFFKWMVDPSLSGKCQYDGKTGRYFV